MSPGIANFHSASPLSSVGETLGFDLISLFSRVKALHWTFPLESESQFLSVSDLVEISLSGSMSSRTGLSYQSRCHYWGRCRQEQLRWVELHDGFWEHCDSHCGELWADVTTLSGPTGDCNWIMQTRTTCSQRHKLQRATLELGLNCSGHSSLAATSFLLLCFSILCVVLRMDCIHLDGCQAILWVTFHFDFFVAKISKHGWA